MADRQKRIDDAQAIHAARTAARSSALSTGFMSPADASRASCQAGRQPSAASVGKQLRRQRRAEGASATASVAPTIAEQHAFLDAAKAFDFVKVRALVNDSIEYVNAGGTSAPAPKSTQAPLLRNRLCYGIAPPAWLLRQEQYGQPECPSKLEELPRAAGAVAVHQKRTYHQGSSGGWAHDLRLVPHEQPVAPRPTERQHEHRASEALDASEAAASRASLAELYSLEHDRGYAAAHNSAAAARMRVWQDAAVNAEATNAVADGTRAWAERQARAWMDVAVATADGGPLPSQVPDGGTATAPDVGGGAAAAAAAAAAAVAGERGTAAGGGGGGGDGGGDGGGVALPIMTFTGDLVAWWACAPGGLASTDGAAVYAEVRRRTGLPAFFIAHSRRVHAGRHAAAEPLCTCAFPPCRCGAAQVSRLRPGRSLAEQGVARDSRLVLHVDALCAVAKPRTPGTARSGDLCVARSMPPPHRSVGMGGCDRTPWFPV